MPTLAEYLDSRWNGLSEQAKKILGLGNQENAWFLYNIWSRQWNRIKEAELAKLESDWS